MKAKKARLILSAIIALFLAMTFCVFGPLEMVLSSASEFWFDVADILPMVGICFLIVFAALFGLLLLLSKWNRIVFPIFFGLGLALYIQGNFTFVDYGVMDGKAIDWGSFGAWPVINTLIWIALLVIPVVLFLKKKKLFRLVATYTSLGIVAMQLITLGTLTVSTLMNSSGDEVDFYISDEGIHTVSDQENVVVFVLDTFDDLYFKELLETEPEFLEPLDGFTYFANNTGLYPSTRGALPYILTGSIYNEQQTYAENIYNGWDTVSHYSELIDAGFDIGLYSYDPIFFSPNKSADIMINLEFSELGISSHSGLAHSLYKATAFRYFPHFMKPLVWYHTAQFNEWKTTVGSDQKAFSWDNIKYYQSLLQNGLTIDNAHKCYRLIHLEGPHPPYTQSIDLINPSPDSTPTSPLEEAKVSLKIVYEYIKSLKEVKVYDQTTLVVMGDHGKTSGLSNPVFLVKSQHSNDALTISNAPVSQADFMGTIMSDLGLNTAETYGKSAFAYEEGSYRQRVFFNYNVWEDNRSTNRLPTIRQYNIPPETNDPTVWRIDAAAYKYSEYSLGKEIFFNASNPTAIDYCVRGFSALEPAYCWTKESEASLAFKVGKVVNDLRVSFTLADVFTGQQEVTIKSDNQILYHGILKKSSQPIHLIVPKESVTEDILQLEFFIPHAISPFSLGVNTDERNLGIALSSLIIEEADDVAPQNSLNDFSLLVIQPSLENNFILSSEGWHSQESKHRWSSENSSLAVDLPSVKGQSISLTFSSYHASGDTEVYLNDHLIATLKNNPSVHTETFLLPAEHMNPDGLQTLTFVTDGATSPAAVGESTDSRNLGIAVRSLSFSVEEESSVQ